MPIEESLRARLERGEIVTELLDGPGGRKDARAKTLIAAPVEKVWEAITDYDRYREFMPQTTGSRVTRREGNTVWFWSEIDLTIKKITYDIKLTLRKETWEVSWTLVSGDLKANDGAWKLEPHGTNETYALYSAFVATNFWLPGAIANRITQGSLPAILTAVRNRVGDRKYRA